MKKINKVIQQLKERNIVFHVEHEDYSDHVATYKGVLDGNAVSIVILDNEVAVEVNGIVVHSVEMFGSDSLRLRDDLKLYCSNQAQGVFKKLCEVCNEGV